MTPAHRSWIVFFDGRSKNPKRLDFGRCSRLQVYIYILGVSHYVSDNCDNCLPTVTGIGTTPQEHMCVCIYNMLFIIPRQEFQPKKDLIDFGILYHLLTRWKWMRFTLWTASPYLASGHVDPNGGAPVHMNAF